MVNILNFEKELAKYGITRDEYEKSLVDIQSKTDWKLIKKKYNINCNPDTIRKASGTPWGGQFVYNYMLEKEKNNKNLDIQKAIDDYGAETAINKDGSYYSNIMLYMSKEDSKNPEFLLKAHGFDTKNWELISVKNNIWNVYSKQDGVQTLYSSKITVKPITGLSIEKINEFYEDLVTKYKIPKVKNTHRETGGFLLEIPIVDLHLGKLSMSDDVAEPYNNQLAKDRFNFIIDDVINNTKGMKIDRIIFPIGQDFFNTDTLSNTTTGGTPQNNDLSSEAMFDQGVMLIIDAVGKLSDIAPVEVFCVNGNHDFLTSYHAICTVWAYFHNNEKVTVDKGTSPRKYIEFGKCLIGYAHGDKEKNRIEGLMQIEARESWGRTLFHEYHLGHLHSEQTKEKNGIIIRNLSSVTGTDAWHHRSGYVGSLKKSQSFIWDRKYGLKNILHTVIE